MKRLLLILFVILFSFIGLANEFEGRGWTFSNEVHWENFFGQVPDLPEKGLYVAVGGDRAFLGAAMAQEAGIEVDGVVNIDRDPLVLAFANALPTLAQTTESPKEFFHKLAGLPQVSWFTWTVVMFRYYSGWANIAPRSLYLDEQLFDQVKVVTAKRDFRTYNLDFNYLQDWQPFKGYLTRRQLKIAVLDISNMLDGYLTPKNLALVIEYLAPFFADNAVVVNTQFCTHGVGHVKTHVRPFLDFVARLNGRTRASLYVPACLHENIPGW